MDVAEMEGATTEGGDPFALDQEFGGDAAADSGSGEGGLAPDEMLPEESGGGGGAAAATGDATAADPFADDFGGGEDAFADAGTAGGEDPFADFSEGGADDFAGADAGTGDAAADPFAGADDFGGDNFSDQAATESPSADEFASDPFPPPAETPAPDTSWDSAQTTTPPISEPMDSMGASAYDTGDSSYSETESVGAGGADEPVAKKNIPVKKIASTPYESNGTLVNAVYIARDGDTIKSVAQKIYGSDRSEDLLAVNPHFRSRGLKVGSKVYYNSPNRPEDRGKLLTYYEDIGLAPEIYVTKEGDNIRKVSKSLLGHERSWQEVYATNDVESKGDLSSGIQLRYWTGTDIPAMAGNTAPSMDTASASSEPEMETPPPPPSMEDMAANEPPPPTDDFAPPPPPPSDPSDFGAAQNNDNDFAPPPPATAEITPPPPPPPSIPPAPSRATAKAESSDETMMLGVG
ncbi:MAG: hypothetical protein KDD22_00215, partial [Bdellovibrionales bacterium]|nr:hypothetical protein [Bdellovibrionales bacterium]